MRKLPIFFTAVVLTSAAPAIAESPMLLSPVFAAAEADAAGAGQGMEPGYIGVRTGDSEKDSFGFGRAGTSTAVPQYSKRPGYIGLLSGDPEEENWGFRITSDPAR